MISHFNWFKIIEIIVSSKQILCLQFMSIILINKFNHLNNLN